MHTLSRFASDIRIYCLGELRVNFVHYLDLDAPLANIRTQIHSVHRLLQRELVSYQLFQVQDAPA